jgi:hypothetical protein
MRRILTLRASRAAERIVPVSGPLDRARAALCSSTFEVDARLPYAATVVRARRALDATAPTEALLDRWSRFHPGSPIGELRYRWPLTHKRARPWPDYAGEAERWQPWRPIDAKAIEDPFELESILSAPAVIADSGELLLELARQGDPVAADLFAEAEPVMRRDFASYVRASSAWIDSFALWRLTRRPLLLERLQPLALAIATTYAATAERTGGIVLGSRYPIHEVPLVSASAHLASALLALGQDLPLVERLLAFVAQRARPGGDWRDLDDRDDLLTTLAAAELLSRIDPSFDPAPTRAYFAGLQHQGGWWRVMGPEVPWLTAEIAGWIGELEERPFAERFRWPYLPRGNRDHKTKLPFFAWFEQIARLFGALPALAAAPTELAFIDLAGFRAFNNSFGQDRGDQVLAAFAEALAAIPAASAIRDGGDEFLVIGAPARGSLAADLEQLGRSWPGQFKDRFGAEVPPVAPRMLLGATRGGGLRAAREVLGREIGALKDAAKTPPPEGILRRLEL